MARSLNKKYFGNRNIGTTGASDNKIGGEGIAGIAWQTLGAFQGNSNVDVLTVPALPAPTIPGGVQATYTAQFEVDSVGTGSGKTDLAVGDTFGVGSIPGMIAIVTDLAGANAVFSVTAMGAARGNALALANIPKDTVGITLTKIAGTGTADTFLVDIAFRVREDTVVITQKGSGYTGQESFLFTKPGTTNGPVPAGVIVLTTDSGLVGSATNQENAIIIHANTDDDGNRVGDIIKQSSARRYKVKTRDGIAICKLVATDTPNFREAYIKATDDNGNTYFVTKLTAHKATLVQWTRNMQEEWLFASGLAVKWSFTSTDNSVIIENA